MALPVEGRKCESIECLEACKLGLLEFEALGRISLGLALGNIVNLAGVLPFIASVSLFPLSRCIY